MTMVSTKTRTSVQVNVYARSITWIANESLRVFVETVTERGLPVNYLHEHFQLLLEGFRTWLTGRWLRGVILEIYDPATDKLVERFDLTFSYEAQPKEKETFETHLNELKKQLSKLPKLLPGCQYRIFADITDNAPDLPGWVRNRPPRSVNDLARQEFGGIIDTAAIGAAMTYFGGSQCKSTTPSKA